MAQWYSRRFVIAHFPSSTLGTGTIYWVVGTADVQQTVNLPQVGSTPARPANTQSFNNASQLNQKALLLWPFGKAVNPPACHAGDDEGSTRNGRHFGFVAKLVNARVLKTLGHYDLMSSILIKSTKMCNYRLTVRSSPFHGEDTSSNLVSYTNLSTGS